MLLDSPRTLHGPCLEVVVFSFPNASIHLAPLLAHSLVMLFSASLSRHLYSRDLRDSSCVLEGVRDLWLCEDKCSINPLPVVLCGNTLISIFKEI